MRISEREYSRILAAKKDGAKPARKPRAASATPPTETAPVRGGRLARIGYAGDEIGISIELAPRPKERARTFFDERALVRAYSASGGEVSRFMGIVKRKGADDAGSIMRTVTPDETRAYEGAVAMIAEAAMRKTSGRFECPVEVLVAFTFQGDPATWPTGQADGDMDNLEKAIFDGMNKVVYLDDRLLVAKGVLKRCGPVPGVSILARPASPGAPGPWLGLPVGCALGLGDPWFGPFRHVGAHDGADHLR